MTLTEYAQGGKITGAELIPTSEASETLYAVHPTNSELYLRVKVTQDEAGWYWPTLSHYYQALGNAGPHIPSMARAASRTPEEALVQGLQAGLALYVPDRASEGKWHLNDDFE